MNSLRQRPSTVVLGACAMLVFGCSKVPLDADFGAIDFGTAHWFANEQVAYVFFSLSEHSSRLINPAWQLHWSATSPSGGVIDHPYAPIDFNQGVHLHQVLPCGDNKICASYSFKSEQPLAGVSIKFLYDADSTSALEKEADVSNHAAGTTADAYSALAYGVFTAGNNRMQVRIHHNFGSPQDELVPSYGLTRQFHAKSLTLRDVEPATAVAEQKKSATALIFPATFCAGQTGADDLHFQGQQGWFNSTLDPTVGDSGACFQTEALDKNGQPLLSGVQPSFGRRNPELSSPVGPTILTPLNPATQIQVVVRICPDDPAAASMVDNDFFAYQEFILGVSRRPTDICFHLGQEAAFGKAFAALLGTRLAQARTQATTNSDYLYVVLLHELFSPEFTLIQSNISAALYAAINADANAVSPRVVGAFVYDSTINYQPNATQRKSIIWCPQSLDTSILSPSTPLADQNCITENAVKLDLKVINFVAPLGPLPSVSQYRNYVKQYGDKGLAQHPKLQLLSVPAGPNTLNEANKSVTYFDSERYVIAAGEAARMCPDREDPSLSSFVIRPETQASDIPGTSIEAINQLWLAANAAGEYKIGIAWDYPFWGGINYTGALNGKVAAIVPYEKSSAAYLELGDQKWSTGSWDFGKYTQHCHRYCDNPFFDATGTYQAQETWRTLQESTCPSPVYPTPPSGGP